MQNGEEKRFSTNILRLTSHFYPVTRISYNILMRLPRSFAMKKQIFNIIQTLTRLLK
jgi:hypothetical protein